MPHTRNPLTTSPLALLRKVRDVMASPESAETRLNKLVAAIAEGFAAEVCSIYLLRAGDILELFANVGFNPSAVHLTRLQVGQGLVGEIAMTGTPLNLAEAKTHNKFVYRPETGEEIYNAFIGVPIIHSDQVMGVLVVQSKDATYFSEDQVEVLQTVSMVLAELTASGKLVGLSELKASHGAALLSRHFSGLRLSPGLACAEAVLHRPRVEIRTLLADNPAQEKSRLQSAIHSLRESVDKLIASSQFDEDSEHRQIMETYRMFTEDRGWLKQINDAIDTGLTAEAAVRKTQEQLHVRMSQLTSPYIQERIHDLEDLSTRLLYHLTGDPVSAAQTALPREFVLVTRTLGPAELLDYGNKGLCGIVLEDGSTTSHIVIIARAMDIPVVGRIQNATHLIQNGEPLVLNGETGDVFVRPPDSVSRAVDEQIRHAREQREHYAAEQHLPAVTSDGVKISLNLNVGLFVNIAQLQAADVDGIGLYRTELPYMTTPHFPDVQAQYAIYAKILEQAGDKRVIFRSIDIGGDKQVPYLNTGEDENPAMGWRATRIAVDRPGILRRQLRALIAAAGNKELNIMFPFIAEVAEFDSCKSLLDREIARAKKQKQAMPSGLRVGAMIEVPSILFQLPALLKRVDFVSIGSNDLLQFLFAWDRGASRMADRYDALCPSVLGIMADIVEQCEKAKVEVGFCGEMARKPLEALGLIAVGLRNLSVPPSCVGPAKEMIRSLDCKTVTEYVQGLCRSQEGSLRAHLEAYARDHGIIA